MQNSHGAVVQLVRTPACHAGGRGFESLPHRFKMPQRSLWGIFSILILLPLYYLRNGSSTVLLPFRTDHKESGPGTVAAPGPCEFK